MSKGLSPQQIAWDIHGEEVILYLLERAARLQDAAQALIDFVKGEKVVGVFEGKGDYKRAYGFDEAIGNLEAELEVIESE